MRLRSTQFVFLVLLACSVQMQGVCATQLLAEAVTVRAGSPNACRVATQAPAPRYRSVLRREPARVAVAMDAASLAAHRVAWDVRRPARESSAVISFTGFLRA